MEEFESYPIDLDVKAVVVGLDTQFTYTKMCIASLYLHTAQAKFIATNNDAYDIVGGRRMPGAGSMVESIQYTLGDMFGDREKCVPEIIGKPNPYVVELIKKEHNIVDPSR